MIYCPRCDKRLTPDHRCAALTRRHFFGLIAGAAAVAAMPKVAAYADPMVLRRGDTLSFKWAGYPFPNMAVLIESIPGFSGTYVRLAAHGSHFVADRPYGR